MLEELAGHGKFISFLEYEVTNHVLVEPAKLANWLPRLPRLTHLSLWQGNALAGTGDLFHVHCPGFKTLKFWDWYGCDPKDEARQLI